MKYMKKMMILLLCVCMLFTACSGSSDTPPETRKGETLPARTSEAETKSGEKEQQKDGVIETYSLTEDMISVDEASGVEYVNSIVVICFDENTSEEERQQIVQGIGGTIVGRIDILDQVQVKVTAVGLAELERICGDLEKKESVKLAKIDGITQQEAREPVYPLYGSYLSWDPNGRINRNWAHLAVESPKAWAYADLLEPVTVGIVDSGFDFSHPDLKRVLTKSEESQDFRTDHGTHVAGIIGADAENRIGIRGIAPNANMIGFAAKRGWAGGMTDSSLDAGMVELVFEGAKVINFSIGYERYPGDDINNKRAKAVSIMMGKLIQCDWDFVVVQSAGNSGSDTWYNGHFCSVTRENCNTEYASKDEILDRIIIVADARRDGTGYLLSSYSSGGDGVDLCAPGMNLYSTVTTDFWRDRDGYKEEDGLFDKNQSDIMASDGMYYGYMSGTSMAAPVVSGVAALVWGADPSLTGPQVKALLCAGDNTPILVKDNPASRTKGDFYMVNAWLPTLQALKSAGKVDENGNVYGEEPETTQAPETTPETTRAEEAQPAGTTQAPETTKAADTISTPERRAFREFMGAVTKGGDFYPIAPDWLYIDNAYFYTTYLARFGVGDVNFDGKEELVIYWNQMSQEGSCYVYDADLEFPLGCSYVDGWSRSFPTLSTDVELTYYSGGAVEMYDHETGYHHFCVVDYNFWSRHPELNIPDYAAYYTYLSVPDQPVNGTYHCLINDSADRAGRDVSEADMKALLADLRAGEARRVELYPVTQENLDRVLQ